MLPPPEVVALRDQLLEKVRHDPKHLLTKEDRITLYNTFGQSNRVSPQPAINQFNQQELFQLALSRADIVVSWLAIITVKNLSDIWQSWGYSPKTEQSSFSHNPFYMMEEAEAYLQNNHAYYEVYSNLHDIFYLGIIGLKNSAPPPQKIYSVYAAYYTLEVVVIDIEELKFEAKFNYHENDPKRLGRDFCQWAVETYCMLNNFSLEEWQNKSYRQRREITVTFDSEKRLEFWKWWLTEAVTAAWARVEG